MMEEQQSVGVLQSGVRLNTGGGGGGFAPWAAGGGGLASSPARGGPGGGQGRPQEDYLYDLASRAGGHFGQGGDLGGGGGGYHAEYQNQGGGDGLGGAIFNYHASVTLVDSELAENLARGGQGGPGFSYSGIGAGGRGGAGGLYNRRGRVQLHHTRLLGNRAEAGPGGEGHNEFEDTYPLGPSGERLGDDCVGDGGDFHQTDSLVGASPAMGCDDASLDTRTVLQAAEPDLPRRGDPVTVRFAVSAGTRRHRKIPRVGSPRQP